MRHYSPVGCGPRSSRCWRHWPNLGDMPLTRLAKVMVMDRTTLTRNLKPLVDKDLIQVQQETDQRVRKIRLSEQGRQTFEQALPYWRDTQTRLVARPGAGTLVESAG